MKLNLLQTFTQFIGWTIWTDASCFSHLLICEMGIFVYIAQSFSEGWSKVICYGKCFINEKGLSIYVLHLNKSVVKTYFTCALDSPLRFWNICLLYQELSSVKMGTSLSVKDRSWEGLLRGKDVISMPNTVVRTEWVQLPAVHPWGRFSSNSWLQQLHTVVKGLTQGLPCGRCSVNVEVRVHGEEVAVWAAKGWGDASSRTQPYSKALQGEGWEHTCLAGLRLKLQGDLGRKSDPCKGP